MIVAIQGQPGSYHHQAANEYFSDGVDCLNLDSFEQVFQALDSGEADQALIASENSLHGSINRVYDLLLEHDVHIVGEHYLQIHHQLITAEPAELADISDVYSHPVAIEQCRRYLTDSLAHAKIHAHVDTAGALQDVLADNTPGKAAIAGNFALEIHGGNVVASNIETNSENYTRFVVLSSQPTTHYDIGKTSIILSMPTDQQSGSLYQALGRFADANINLTKLESRPIIGRAWHYLFYIDLETTPDNQALSATLAQLQSLGYTIRNLGSY